VVSKRPGQHAAGDAATLAARPSAARRPSRDPDPEAAAEPQPTPSGERSRSHPATSIASEHAIARALRDDEQMRAHGFSGLAAVMSLCLLGTLPMLHGDRIARLASTVAVTLIVVASLVIWRLTRPAGRLARNAMRAYGFMLGSCVLVVQYYFGLYSAGIVVVTVGIYYFGQSADRVQSVYMPALMTSAYLVAALLVSADVLPDVGLINSHAGLETRLFAISQVTLVLALTARMATLSRRSMRDAMARSHEAMALARRGEALLVEAQQQLERALGIVVGQPSHYSGQIAGPFQLGVVIGVGAMGEVYAAEHVETAQPAAVKLMRPSSLSRPDLVERFLREGAISSALHSPNLVTIHEVGQLADGAPYMAMELLRGQDLAARLRKEGRLPPHEVLELARALAAGLSVVHEGGVVHRDLKPVNVFHAEQAGGPCWKILDFGISKPARSSGTLTDVGVVGTPGYMSPEQARGLPLDHRSDVFAMGVLLYRALTGRPAFIGSDTPQIMFDVAYKMPEQPSAVLALLPGDVDLVFALALAKDPKQRCASAHELAEALALGLRQELSPELRARARALLSALPWGQPAVAGMQADAHEPA